MTDVIDAQIHVVSSEPPPGVAHRYLSVEQVRAEMSAVGVGRAVLVHRRWEGFGNEAVIAAASRYPQQFAVAARRDVLDPVAVDELAQWWRAHPCVIGVRVIMADVTSVEADPVRPGSAVERFWRSAQDIGIPLMVYAPGQLDLVREIAQRYPALRLTVDHMGYPISRRREDLASAVDQVVRMSRLSNVSLKASALPCYAADAFPFVSVRDDVLRVVHEFGPERVFWGSDLTRLPCSYADAVAMMSASLDTLGRDVLHMIMGQAFVRWFGWPPGTLRDTASVGPAR